MSDAVAVARGHLIQAQGGAWDDWPPEHWAPIFVMDLSAVLAQLDAAQQQATQAQTEAAEVLRLTIIQLRAHAQHLYSEAVREWQQRYEELAETHSLCEAQLRDAATLNTIMAAIQDLPHAIELYNNGGSEYPNG